MVMSLRGGKEVFESGGGCAFGGGRGCAWTLEERGEENSVIQMFMSLGKYV